MADSRDSCSILGNFPVLKVLLPASLAVHVVAFNLGFGVQCQVALFVASAAVVWKVTRPKEEEDAWDIDPPKQQAPASSDDEPSKHSPMSEAAKATLLETSCPSSSSRSKFPPSEATEGQPLPPSHEARIVGAKEPIIGNETHGSKERSSPDSVVKLHDELSEGGHVIKSEFWAACREIVESEVVGTMHRGQPGMKHVNCWTPVPASSFLVRGKEYLNNAKKMPSEGSHFEPVGVDTFTIEAAQSNLAPWRDGVFSQVKGIAAAEGRECPRMLIVNWVVPGSPMINHVQYYAERAFTPVTEDDKMFKKMLDHFMAEGSDDFRRKRFKMIASVQEGPWLITQAINKPALIGKKLDMTCHVGKGYLEITIDISSSKIAANVLGMCTSVAKSLVIDMAYVIEGRKEAELPERLLGGIRIHHIDMSAVPTGPQLPLPT